MGGYVRRAVMSYEQTRSFLNFNFFQRNERVEKEADMDPGLEKMMELAKRERMRARMPPAEDVDKALRDFFRSKSKRKSPITDNQAQLALQSLRYLLSELARGKVEQVQQVQEQPNANEMKEVHQVTLMRFGLVALEWLPSEVTRSHVELATLLYDTWAILGHSVGGMSKALINCVRVLTQQGETRGAERLVLQFEEALQKIDQSPDSDTTQFNAELEIPVMEHDIAEEEQREPLATTVVPRSLRTELSVAWTLIVEGFARERNDVELHRVLLAIRNRDIRPVLMGVVALTMAEYRIKRDDIVGAREWWQQHRSLSSKYGPSTRAKAASALKAMLMWCLDHDQLGTGHEIVKDLMSQNPRKEIWDVVFVWAAGTGKGVDEINRMMSVMEKYNESITKEHEWRVVDIETINALVEFAVKRKDPYMAERFITLGQSRNIEPNARTYVLQMEYRLSVDDVDGALIAYKSLQSMDTSSNEDLPVVNRLIVALCKTQRHDFDTIMNVTADLSDRRATFSAETVAALALLHLNRDEHHDVLDLLNTHAYHYSTSGRELLRDTFLTTALDPKAPTARAWNSYLLIHDFFDETPRPQRTELMEAFMARERADMGVRIFQQMRQHSRPDTIPTIDTYVAAFLGLAKIRDLDALDIVHNQLKLDYNVVATTYCYNALMLGYIACGDAEVGLRFWNNIVASKEGPSYNSIHIALRACEKTAFGDLKAREIWSLLRRRNVDLDHNLWCSYLASLCGNGNVDQSLNAAEEAEEKGEVVVDEFLIGSLCDATPKYSEKQAMIEEWATDRYPDVWKKLVEVVGFEELPTGVRKFKVDRRVSP